MVKPVPEGYSTIVPYLLVRNAIRDSKTTTGPMQLVFSAEEFVNVVSFDYHDGARYPHLERVAAVPDWLGELGKPKR